MALAKSRQTTDQLARAGFSLIEVLIAMTILSVGLASLAQLFAMSTRANAGSKNTTFASVLAQQKMEQLRALTWGFDTLGLPLSDTTTDLTVAIVPAGQQATVQAPRKCLR